MRDCPRCGLFVAPQVHSGHAVGFHNLERHSLATFLMDEQENPAVVQAIMRHAKMDMTLYYSHSSKKAKRAAVENYAQRIAPKSMRVQMRVQQSQTVN
jgi:site-specific recombinase XerD